MDNLPEPKMVEMVLARIVLRDGDGGQQIYLLERGGKRGFAMAIGRSEAEEIKRIAANIASPRPFTHRLAHNIVQALGARIVRADIVGLHDATFLAQLWLAPSNGAPEVALDARPSDAIALALRAGAPLRIAEFVLEEARTDRTGPDPLPDEPPPAAD